MVAEALQSGLTGANMAIDEGELTLHNNLANSSSPYVRSSLLKRTIC